MDVLREYSSLFTEAYLLEQFGYKIPFADYQQGVGTVAELSFYEGISQAVGRPVDAEHFEQRISSTGKSE
ncbi:TPA: hypothetical protein LP616_002552 [Enterococcus faecium]|nr:hypothetical protein [Enterococcus faecium]